MNRLTRKGIAQTKDERKTSSKVDDGNINVQNIPTPVDSRQDIFVEKKNLNKQNKSSCILLCLASIKVLFTNLTK